MQLTRLRSLWHDVNASYWFYPAVFSGAALALALLTLWLDRAGMAEALANVEFIIPARSEGARTMLTVIAGAMIGVASTVFSITIAAVAYASGNYGPRLLTNFMEDRGNQLSLATFIATFVFSLVVLRSVRSSSEGDEVLGSSAINSAAFVPQLSLLVAFLLAGISVAVLVYFLNHIPASIRINSVLEGIGSRLIRSIRHNFPDDDSGWEPPCSPEGMAINALKPGYIQIIDYGALQACAEKYGGRITLKVRTGDFIHPNLALCQWCLDDDRAGTGLQEAGMDEIPEDAIRGCFALGTRRTPNQDLNFLIDELVEIALRALSPGINDPFTAIMSLHWLGAATAQLAQRDLRLSLEIDQGADDCRVFPLSDDFAHYLARGFGSIRSGTATNRIAALVHLDALANAATTLNNESRMAMVLQEAEILLQQARLELQGPELDDLEARHATFVKRLAV